MNAHAPSPERPSAANEPPRKYAAKSSFYRAMAILPPEQRDAMFEIYAFCRAVDDIADEEGDAATKTAQLGLWRQAIDDLYLGRPNALSSGLITPRRRYAFAKQDFLDLIDGMQMDVDGPIVAPDLATFDLYCDRVASSVGRLSGLIFGLRAEQSDQLAHHLGRALQLTNILRDIDEDARIGRLYLPRELLERVDAATLSPAAVAALPDLSAVCEPIVTLARTHFQQADAIMNAQPRACVRAPRMMSAAYGNILNRLHSRGFKKPRHHVKPSKARLLMALLQYGFF